MGNGLKDHDNDVCLIQLNCCHLCTFSSLFFIAPALKPHYNMVVYSTNSVITRLRPGSHCLN